ncbi:phosphotransferase [Mycobacterium sp. MS1601]|uniref:phosphotransferase n=1 Tax=Mycobacterium sp. MS1601 TaxID=1936029 RepID=UPI000979465C|nr:phosphotransferase [Mycobacterium sp. MS1601]AQA06386.1 phosphotransferase [Mycobacterium sp. MS1601]
MTGDELATRRDRAVQAAIHAGRQLGLGVVDGVVLHDVFSVVVHLRPEPVVARIQVVTPPGLAPEDRAARQQRELDVVAWLADHDVAVVGPSPLVPMHPAVQDGFAMTFWELADVSADHQPYAGVDVGLTAPLYAALARYPASLPFLAPFNSGLPQLLSALTESELLSWADIDRARAEFEALSTTLGDQQAFARAFPGVTVQPLHGDGPSHNVIRTVSGIKFSDFEDVCLGPVEWDLAHLGPAANDEYDTAARELGLRVTDPTVQQMMDAARTLQFVGCAALIPELPILAEGLAPAIAAWRSHGT